MLAAVLYLLAQGFKREAETPELLSPSQNRHAFTSAPIWLVKANYEVSQDRRPGGEEGGGWGRGGGGQKDPTLDEWKGAGLQAWEKLMVVVFPEDQLMVHYIKIFF